MKMYLNLKNENSTDYLIVNIFILIVFAINLNAQERCNTKQIIGSSAFITLPQIGIVNIKSKVDTGARTSSLHCSEILIDTTKKWVTFVPLNRIKSIKMPISKITAVKSSNASVEKRAFVKLNVIINNCLYTAEFSLTNRTGMRYPVLLGRSLLKNNFIVDVSFLNVGQI